MSDIARLFAEDPLKLTKENIDEMISALRQARAQFNLGDKTAGNKSKLAPLPKIEKIDMDHFK